MANEINHEVFGNINYDYGWVKESNMYCWGEKRLIKVIIDAEEDADFESNQEEAYKIFFSNYNNFIAKAEKAVFKYYQEICSDYRDKLSDDDKDKNVPIVTSEKDMVKLVKPKQIFFPMTFDKDVREVGILLDCTWEIEHGLAVKFQNEEIVEVGYQDIIL